MRRQRRQRSSVLVLRRLVLVAFFIEVGLLLIVLPWSAFWERNYFAESWPILQPLMTNNFVRGAVTGLGVVNLFAGFADLALVFAGRATADGHSDAVDDSDHREFSERP